MGLSSAKFQQIQSALRVPGTRVVGVWKKRREHGCKALGHACPRRIMEICTEPCQDVRSANDGKHDDLGGSPMGLRRHWGQ